jgi:hypothetical protein
MCCVQKVKPYTGKKALFVMNNDLIDVSNDLKTVFLLFLPDFSEKPRVFELTSTEVDAQGGGAWRGDCEVAFNNHSKPNPLFRYN